MNIVDANTNTITTNITIYNHLIVRVNFLAMQSLLEGRS